MLAETALRELESMTPRLASQAVDMYVDAALSPFRAVEGVPEPVLKEILRKFSAALRGYVEAEEPAYWMSPERTIVKSSEFYEQAGRQMFEARVEETWKFDGKKLLLLAAHKAIPAAYFRDFAAISSRNIQVIYGDLMKAVAVRFRFHYEHNLRHGGLRAREILAEPEVRRAAEGRKLELSTYGLKVHELAQLHLQLEWELRARVL